MAKTEVAEQHLLEEVEGQYAFGIELLTGEHQRRGTPVRAMVTLTDEMAIGQQGVDLVRNQWITKFYCSFTRDTVQ